MFINMNFYSVILFALTISSGLKKSIKTSPILSKIIIASNNNCPMFFMNRVNYAL